MAVQQLYCLLIKRIMLVLFNYYICIYILLGFYAVFFNPVAVFFALGHAVFLLWLFDWCVDKHRTLMGILASAGFRIVVSSPYPLLLFSSSFRCMGMPFTGCSDAGENNQN